jgi:hypothetical protein
VIDLVAINRRLENRRFLSGPSDESFFSHLIAQIRGLERPGEKIVIPDFNEADAWAKAWELYEALQRRAPTPEAVLAEVSGRTMAAVNRRLQQCADDTAALKAFRDSHQAQWSVLCEYVGFDEQDLNPPPVDPHYGVPEGWDKRASRVAGALARLAGMSESERRDAPRMVEERRRREFLRDLDRRIERLEQAQDLIAEEMKRLGKALGAMQPREAA